SGSVTGGGSAPATFNDSTTIVSPPKIISISSSPSPPIANQVANLTVNGTGFDPNSAFFTVSGPGCNTTNCTVPNSALTIKPTNQLIGAFTFPATGGYALTVINGVNGTVSNPVTIAAQ